MKTILRPLALLALCTASAHALPASQETRMPRQTQTPPSATAPDGKHMLAVGGETATIREGTHVFGAATDGDPHCVYCFNSDDNSATGLSNFYAGMTVNGAAATGHKNAMMAVIAVTARTANRPRPQSYYTAQGSAAIASTNDNGTAEQPVGNLFGGNDVATLRGGATFWNSLVGREITYGAERGSNAAFKVGFQVVVAAEDAVQGSVADYGYALGAQAGGAQPGVRIGFAVGGRGGVWPIDPRQGVILAPDPSPTLADAGGAIPPLAAKGGIDLDRIAFGAFAYRSKGFLVDGEGATSAKTLTLKEVAADSIAAPASGSQTIFLDAADHRLKRKDASGTITVIG